jgi:hypothetical protein
LDTVYAQFAAMRAQTIADWRLCVVADDSSIGRIVERAAARDPRIAWSEAASGEDLVATECRAALSLDADWLVLLGEGALLHRRALEWFAAVAYFPFGPNLRPADQFRSAPCGPRGLVGGRGPRLCRAAQPPPPPVY